MGKAGQGASCCSCKDIMLPDTCFVFCLAKVLNSPVTRLIAGKARRCRTEFTQHCWMGTTWMRWAMRALLVMTRCRNERSRVRQRRAAFRYCAIKWSAGRTSSGDVAQASRGRNTGAGNSGNHHAAAVMRRHIDTNRRSQPGSRIRQRINRADACGSDPPSAPVPAFRPRRYRD